MGPFSEGKTNGSHKNNSIAIADRGKKNMVRKITKRIENKYNVSIAETDFQDLHQKIGIGIVFIAGDNGMADSIMDHILSYISGISEAEIIDIDREIEHWN